MTAIYIIDHTDPANGSFTINPNKLNGPGSVSQNTNLSLYGAGSLRYGEGINENLLHLLENFASPEATTGGSPDVGLGVPDATYFNPAKAIKGQLWFNSSTNKLMMYDGSNWISAGGTSVGPTAPPAPAEGDLWFDTNTTQLKIYYSMVWTSVAAHYVSKSGDTMTGILTLSGDPTNPLEAVTKQYADALIDSSNELGELTDVNVGGAADTHALVYNAGNWINYDIQADLDTKLNLNGLNGPMTGLLTLSGDPSTNLQAATKQYVDTHSLVFNTGLSSPGLQNDGDMWIDNVTPRIYIQAANVWRQIWPAQYA